jgi:hypothetical protein
MLEYVPISPSAEGSELGASVGGTKLSAMGGGAGVGGTIVPEQVGGHVAEARSLLYPHRQTTVPLTSAKKRRQPTELKVGYASKKSPVGAP